jgi:hypothetical protein
VAAIHILVCLIAALLMLRNHAEQLKKGYSSLEKLLFSWLRNLLLVNCVLWLAWVVAR